MNSHITLRPAALLVASLAVALGLTLGMSLSTGAADAPRKGAERLTQSGAPLPARQGIGARSTPVMHSACGACTTVTTSQTSDTAKGGEILIAHGKPSTLRSTHGCGGCSTTIGVTGFGKSKAQTVTHGCSRPSLASASCCR